MHGDGAAPQVVERRRRPERRQHRARRRARCTPIGAICTAPSAVTVVMMLSRIIGIGPLLARRRALRASGRRARCAVDRSGASTATPQSQRSSCDVALAELPGDLGAGQLDAEVERVRAVILDAELGEQRRTRRAPRDGRRGCRRGCRRRRPRCGSCGRAPAPPSRRSRPGVLGNGRRSRSAIRRASLPMGRLPSSRAACMMRRAASAPRSRAGSAGSPAPTSTSLMRELGDDAEQRRRDARSCRRRSAR